MKIKRNIIKNATIFATELYCVVIYGLQIFFIFIKYSNISEHADYFGFVTLLLVVL